MELIVEAAGRGDGFDRLVSGSEQLMGAFEADCEEGDLGADAEEGTATGRERAF